jgi:hypothetical protein
MRARSLICVAEIAFLAQTHTPILDSVHRVGSLLILNQSKSRCNRVDWRKRYVGS